MMEIYIWKSSQTTPINTLEGHGDSINRLLSPSLNPDLLVSCSDDATHRLWHPDRQKDHTEQCMKVFGPKEEDREISLISELSGSGILISVFGHPDTDSTSSPSSYTPDNESSSEEGETHSDTTETIPSQEPALASSDNDHFYLFPTPKTPLIAEGDDDDDDDERGWKSQNDASMEKYC